MIRVVCSGCGQEHECLEALAGLSMQCKKCFTFMQVPREPQSTAITPAPPEPRRPSTTAITESEPSLRRIDEPGEPPTAPADIPDWQLRTWFDTWMNMGVKIQDMETKLIERGCTPRFARWYIQQALEGHIGDGVREQANAVTWLLVLGIAAWIGAAALVVCLGRIGLAGGLAFVGFGLLVRWYLATRPAD